MVEIQNTSESSIATPNSDPGRVTNRRNGAATLGGESRVTCGSPDVSPRTTVTSQVTTGNPSGTPVPHDPHPEYSDRIHTLPSIEDIPGDSQESSTDSHNRRDEIRTTGEPSSPVARDTRETLRCHSPRPVTPPHGCSHTATGPSRLRHAPHRSDGVSPARWEEPPTVRVEVVVVEGDEGRWLAARQAAVIRTALTWLATHPSDPQARDRPPQEDR
jgi:hypothetical protein